jgi:hypothetical protein
MALKQYKYSAILALFSRGIRYESHTCKSFFAILPATNLTFYEALPSSPAFFSDLVCQQTGMRALFHSVTDTAIMGARGLRNNEKHI